MSSVRTNIYRWGNSRGIRLPKTVLDLAGLKDDDEVSLMISDGSIIIRKASEEQQSYPSLAERFSCYTGDYAPEKWDTGASVGKEI